MEPTSEREIYDQPSFYARIGADAQLAQELIALMQRDAGPMLAQIDAAANAGDALALERAAHALKGAVSNFSAFRASAAAAHLEGLAQAGEVAAAAVAQVHLEMAALLQALATDEAGATP